jgi:hypothetical protein
MLKRIVLGVLVLFGSFEAFAMAPAPLREGPQAQVFQAQAVQVVQEFCTTPLNGQRVTIGGKSWDSADNLRSLLEPEYLTGLGDSWATVAWVAQNNYHTLQMVDAMSSTDHRSSGFTARYRRKLGIGWLGLKRPEPLSAVQLRAQLS